MKISNRQTNQEWFEKKKQWHRFFPLYPRYIKKNDFRYFEWIERKGTFYNIYPCWWEWEYRLIIKGRKK